MNLYYYWQCVSSKVFSWTYLIFYFFQRKYYELKSLLLFHLTLVKFKELQREHYPYMNFSKCTVMGREAYKKICNVIIERNLITFDVTPTLSFFSRWSYEANLFWDYHPHQYSYKIEWRRDADYAETETLTHDFYFFEIFDT